MNGQNACRFTQGTAQEQSSEILSLHGDSAVALNRVMTYFDESNAGNALSAVKVQVLLETVRIVSEDFFGRDASKICDEVRCRDPVHS